MEPVKLGIIGCGVIGTSHASQASKSPLVDLVAGRAHAYISVVKGHKHDIQPGIRRRCRHARKYAERLADRLLDLPYRFFTFNIPAGLRSLVNQNAELLKIVQDSVFVALQETLETAYNNELEKKASRKGLKREKDLKLKTGMLAGLQTFGGDMKTHIHEHCIVVDGGLDEYSQIVAEVGRESDRRMASP